MEDLRQDALTGRTRNSALQLITLALPRLTLIKDVSPLSGYPPAFGRHLGTFDNNPEEESLKSPIAKCNGTLILCTADEKVMPASSRSTMPMKVACNHCGLSFPWKDGLREGWEPAILAWMKTVRNAELFFDTKGPNPPEGLEEFGYTTSAWFSLQDFMPKWERLRNEEALMRCLPPDTPPGSRMHLFPVLAERVIIAGIPALENVEGRKAMAGIAAVLERRTAIPLHQEEKRNIKPEKKGEGDVKALFGLKSAGTVSSPPSSSFPSDPFASHSASPFKYGSN